MTKYDTDTTRHRSSEVNRRYRRALNHLKNTDWETYQAVASRVASQSTIADQWRNRAILAESRLAVLEAHQESK
ncbi:hypothetical protein [Arthrobacter rhombi]|uniref:hypothetical protein n=1 Tax=Arthrobacter rhombi TaxID=71253 RepID=UPI003FD09B69